MDIALHITILLTLLAPVSDERQVALDHFLNLVIYYEGRYLGLKEILGQEAIYERRAEVEYTDHQDGTFDVRSIRLVGHLKRCESYPAQQRRTRPVDATDLLFLKPLAELRQLELANTDIDDDSLAVLSHLKNLETLYLYHPQGRTTDAAMKHIGRLTKLKVLRMSSTQVTDAGLIHLASLENLREIWLPRRVTDAGLLHLRGFRHLEYLWMTPEMTDNGVAALHAHPHLRILWLPYTITDAGLAHLRALSKLEELHLSSKHVTDAGLAYIGECNNLKKLYLLDMNISDNGLKHLVPLTMMEVLAVGGSAVTDDGMANISKFRGLKRLSLSGTQISDRGLATIRHLTALEQLSLHSCKNITNEGLRHLRDMVRLETLDLARTGVTSEGMQELSVLSNLRVLELLGTNVSNSAIESLQRELPKLTVRKITFGHGGQSAKDSGNKAARDTRLTER